MIVYDYIGLGTLLKSAFNFRMTSIFEPKNFNSLISIFTYPKALYLQEWSSETPHKTTPRFLEKLDNLDHNYCRNPDDGKRPWYKFLFYVFGDIDHS